MPIGHRLFETFKEQCYFGRGRRCLPRQQARMAAGLAQAQQGFEGCQHAATGSKERNHIGQRGGTYGVIDDAFAVAKQAAQNHVGTWWQLGGHLSLPAPQHKWFQTFAQAFGSARSAVSDGTRVASLEILAAAEQPTVEEVQLTPELIEAVLHRCASEGQTEMGA